MVNIEATQPSEARHGAIMRVASWLAGSVLVLSLLLAAWSYVRDRAHDTASERQNALIIVSERLLSGLKDVETGMRGFIITGQESYLEPYRSGTVAVGAARGTIASMLGPDADKLNGVVAERLAEAARGIAIYRTEGPAAGADRVRAGAGKELMDQTRSEVARIQREAGGRIAAIHGSRGTDTIMRIASVLGLVLSCVVLGLVAVDRRREQQASQALLEGVLENAPVGLGFLDPSLRIRHINQALARMSERALSAAPGMSIWEVIPQLRDSLEARLARVAEGGRVTNAEVEAASNTRAGQTRYFQASFYPLRQQDARREPGGVGMVIADVTARRRAERSTRESEERFRSLVQASTSMIWTADATGAFTRAQPSWTRFTGQSEDESLGWGRLACVHPEDVERTRAAWAVATSTRTPIALEHRLRRDDGEWRYMALSVAPVLEEDGSIREWVGSHTDITARKDAEFQLSAAKDAAEAANRAKSSFLANMSHELRTPLSAVIGYSEMLEEEAEELGQESMISDLGKIKSNARHLLSLINDVLDLSKIEANKMDVYAETFDVAAFGSDVASTVDTLVRQKSNTMKLDLGEGLGTMHSDAVKLRQCLFNLLGNASKFTERGSIELRIRRDAAGDGDWLSFAVADSGIGMTAGQLQRLFQRFTQADETTTRRFGGTGLGLALSRAFSRLLGGDITVESREGHGTCFTIRVPAVLPERTMPVEDPLADVEPPPGDARRELVLVIDDEASQRDLLSRFLERQRFDVRTARDGTEGLALARALKPRAILLDVMMPQMDGWSVLTALKDDADLARIPVVMVSFVAESGLGAALGAADYVPKPIDWLKLKGVMDQFRQAEGDVLVVDDDHQQRQRLRTVLEKNGWTVQEAGNGAEALERILHTPPHLVLLDLTMPVMDGFAFLQRLRETPGCGDIPVVVLTARDITVSERERLAEADRVLKKGEISMRELAGEIRAIENRQPHAAS